MKYDKSLDKIVKVFLQREAADGLKGVRVVARQYNGGAIKVAAEEVLVRRGEPISIPLKRIPLDMLAEVALAFAEAAADPDLRPAPPEKARSEPPPKRSIWSAS